MSTLTPRLPAARVAPVAVPTGALPYRDLYATAGGAALIIALLMPLQILVYMLWPPPMDGTALEWFTIFRDNRWVGLLSLDLLLMVDYVLIVPTLLALYIALRPVNPSFVLLAVVLNLLAIAIYFSSNTAIEMMHLSTHFDDATPATRAQLLAAGEMALATYSGTAFHVSYILASVAGLVVALVMLHSAHFSKLTAYLGILGNGVGVGLYVPDVGLWLSIFSVFFLEGWYILLGLRLLEMARMGSPAASGHEAVKA